MRITALLIILTALAAVPALAQYPAGGYSGTVIETMDSGKYTYVLVDTGSEQVWGAAPQFEVEVGEEVLVPTEMPMPDFRSKTLDRSFELLFFASAIPRVGGIDPAELEAHSHDEAAAHSKPKVEEAIGIRDINPAEQTVGELFSKRDDYAGRKVLVRGQVVKVLSGIMGTNWLHIQDGTGEAGGNDLTVTTDAKVSKGDVVLVGGKLTLNKDFGMGYFYELIVENAAVMVE